QRRQLASGVAVEVPDAHHVAADRGRQRQVEPHADEVIRAVLRQCPLEAELSGEELPAARAGDDAQRKHSNRPQPKPNVEVGELGGNLAEIGFPGDYAQEQCADPDANVLIHESSPPRPRVPSRSDGTSNALPRSCPPSADNVPSSLSAARSARLE